ncbi:DUF3298 and DUF4163 domain-containing protein [uncultured Psychroserpens sp.]|uniref:DUF3298 and DUF4163 domain-containing protein n=1 Tax=uncultured Psychroserpens sp. TaxID=255436 RepID=UPI002630261A|nr:DUF3298 and DUF4163 domain-containing protein [uncultured Psychroserpens sp.]
MKKTYCLFICILVLFSCKEDISIIFSEKNIESSAGAEISVNYPKATSTNEGSELINSTLENYIANQLNLGDELSKNTKIEDALKQFNNEFISFKEEFPEVSHKWEAFIDGEITYQSPELICIAVNSYLDTGGAHGNTHIKFLNFDAQTGKLLSKEDLILNTDELSKVVEKKLKTEIKANADDQSMEDVFFGKDFQLPESIGYSDEGLIILYNTYEIASYAQGIIEFTIPFEEISSFITVN